MAVVDAPTWAPYAHEINHKSRFGFPSKSPWCDPMPLLNETDRFVWFREIRRDLDHGYSELDGLGECLMLSGFSYLGLNRRPEVREAVIEALDRFGSGSAGSRWLAGHTDLHRQQEEMLAEHAGTEDAITFSSGFVTNSNVIPALTNRHDEVFADRLNHASLVDGCKNSGAKFTRFPHNDMEELERKLKASTAKRRMVVVDGVTSMHGTVIRAPELVELCRRYEAILMADECHSHFVLGPNGGGLTDYYGMEKGSIDLEMGSLGKALHAAGGYITGSQDLCTYLRRAARGFIYSRSISPMDVAAGIAALEIFKREGPELAAKLQRNRRAFVNALHEAGLPEVEHGPTPIVPIPAGSDGATVDSAVALQKQNVCIHPVVAPVVPKGKAILRASMMSSHRVEDLEDAAGKIAAAVHEARIYWGDTPSA